MKPFIEKNSLIKLFSLVVGSILCSFVFTTPPLLNKKMPQIVGLTVKNVKIDSNYFKNKVTLITFFYVGCPPCMNEIAALMKLKKNKDFQVLYIAPHTASQMKQFNSDYNNDYSFIRNYYKAQKITFDILPECEKEAERYVGEDKNTIKPECGRISQLFHVFGYPATFIIDRKCIVRSAHYGFSVEKKDSSEVKKLQREIDICLRQP